MTRSLPMSSQPRIDSLPIPAIILAGGASTRLGQPKQLLRLPAFGGETLLDHTVGLARAAGETPIFVVLGAHAEEILREAQLLGCTMVRNEDWAEGMASSIRAGISAMVEQVPEVSGALVLVCDQIGLTAEHLGQLLAAHRSEPGDIVASQYAGHPGVPAVFPPALFSALLALKGDRGARAIFDQPGLSILQIEFPQGEWDIDSPEDLERPQSSAQTRRLAR